MALLSMLSFNGFGTYVGLIFVFLISKPTKETPLGTMTPPKTLFSLCRILLVDDKSKSDVVEKGGKRKIVCDSVDEFMTVLELVRTVVDKDIIAYSDAVTKK